jgi:hypothetical protein
LHSATTLDESNVARSQDGGLSLAVMSSVSPYYADASKFYFLKFVGKYSISIILSYDDA